ncbi:hypothetical protein [Demequina sp.]|uniref:hypothetical protein n=1 Tax=Demequina sp. TaxID=2050685 RepID=UPI003A864367
MPDLHLVDDVVGLAAHVAVVESGAVRGDSAFVLYTSDASVPEVSPDLAQAPGTQSLWRTFAGAAALWEMIVPYHPQRFAATGEGGERLSAAIEALCGGAPKRIIAPSLDRKPWSTIAALFPEAQRTVIAVPGGANAGTDAHLRPEADEVRRVLARTDAWPLSPSERSATAIIACAARASSAEPHDGRHAAQFESCLAAVVAHGLTRAVLVTSTDGPPPLPGQAVAQAHAAGVDLVVAQHGTHLAQLCATGQAPLAVGVDARAVSGALVPDITEVVIIDQCRPHPEPQAPRVTTTPARPGALARAVRRLRRAPQAIERRAPEALHPWFAAFRAWRIPLR